MEKGDGIPNPRVGLVKWDEESKGTPLYIEAYNFLRCRADLPGTSGRDIAEGKFGGRCDGFTGM
jgi:fatty acid/phospholipid biosynthesis enzyme